MDAISLLPVAVIMPVDQPLWWMNAVFAVVITVPVLTVPVYPMAQAGRVTVVVCLPEILVMIVMIVPTLLMVMQN